MSVDVCGKSFDAFDTISSGHYNHGEVIVSDKGLSKVNNHHYLTALNRHANDVAANNEARKTFYAAILGDARGRALSESQLAAIRGRLGLGDDRGIGDAEIGDRALTRREIRQIVNYVKEAGSSHEMFGANCLRKEVGDKIDALELSSERKQILKDNLLGEKGQLGRLEKAFNDCLDAILKSEIRDFEDRNSYTGLGQRSYDNAKNACSAFIDKFVGFCKAADSMKDSAGAKFANDINAELKELQSSLDKIDADGDRKAGCRKSIESCRICLDGLKGALGKDIDDRLSNLRFVDFDNDGPHAPDKLAAVFVGQKLADRGNALSRALVRLKADITGLSKDVEAKRKVAEGHEAIKGLFDLAARKLEDSAKNIASLCDCYRDLALNQRNEERLDGDRVNAAMEEIAVIHKKALDDKAAVSTAYRKSAASFTADDIGAKCEEFKAKLGQIVAKEIADINAKIDMLNGQLGFTRLPKLGEDPANALKVTQEKRAALTERLTGEWTSAKSEMEEVVEAAVTDIGKLGFLTQDEKVQIDAEFAKLRDRFGDGNRDIYVNLHPAGGLKPSDILAKAKADVAKLLDNARAIDRSEFHQVVQRKLDMLNQWVSGHVGSFAIMLGGLCSFTGTDVSSFNFDAATGAGLHQLVQFDVGSRMRYIGEMSDALVQGKSYHGQPVTVEDVNREIDALLRRELNLIRDKGVVERAGNSSRLLNAVINDIQAEFSGVILQNPGSVAEPSKPKASFFGRVSKTENVPLKPEIISANARDMAQMLAGYNTLFVVRYVAGNMNPDDSYFKEQIAGMKRDFKSITSRRQLLDRAREKYAQMPEIEPLLRNQLNNLGRSPTLSEDTIRKLLEMKNPTADRLLAIITADPRQPTVVEDFISYTENIESKIGIGSAPEAPSAANGIDGGLGVPADPAPQDVPVLDKMVKA